MFPLFALSFSSLDTGSADQKDVPSVDYVKEQTSDTVEPVPRILEGLGCKQHPKTLLSDFSVAPTI